MKKMFALLLALILVFSCACGEEPAVESSESAAEEESKSAIDPNAIIDAIDETTPLAGTYSVHSKVGIEQMSLHPDAKFTLLRDIDLEGAELKPIENFTGTIDGANYSISNFTISAPDANGNQGFIGLNRGSVKNISFKNVTVTTTEATKNVGVFAGVNEGTLARNSQSGTITADALASGAACGTIAGINKKEVSNTISDVDIIVNSAGEATVGGAVGISEGGSVSNIEQNGLIRIADAGQKTAGLIVGKANNTEVKACAFVGAENTVGGTLFTDLAGESTGSTIVTKCLTRDNGREPLPEAQQKLRDRVVEQMYAMGTVEWHVKEKLYHDCTCSLTACHGIFYPEVTYYGMPYGHKGSSLDRFHDMVDEDGYVIDWAYSQPSLDSFDCYMQNDCSSALFQAWVTVSNTIDFHRVSGQTPMMKLGCISVGDYTDEINYQDRDLSTDWIGDGEGCLITEDELLECYAQMRKGDAYWYKIAAGGHTRMAAEDPVVVRDQDGKIDAQHSYLICDEQGATQDFGDIYTSWKINWKYTFASLLTNGCFPITCEELLTGEMETPEAHFEGAVDGKAGLYTGYVKANYYLDEVNMTIKNSAGEVVFNKNAYPTLGRVHDGSDGGGGADTVIRGYCDTLDMGMFATLLQEFGMEIGGTYDVTLTARLGTGDRIVVREFSFTNGSKTAKK